MQEWYHWDCLGLEERDIKQGFVCPHCLHATGSAFTHRLPLPKRTEDALKEAGITVHLAAPLVSSPRFGAPDVPQSVVA